MPRIPVLDGRPGNWRCGLGWHRVRFLFDSDRGYIPTCTRCDGIATWWLAERMLSVVRPAHKEF